MKEPTKNEIAKAVIALMDLQTYYIRGWKIPKQVGKAIEELINDLRFQYQFQQR